MRKGVKLKLPIAVCLLAGINACMVCPEDEVFYQIGKFASRDEALRAAIPELAKIIRKCPQARTYRVVFTAPGVYRVDRHALLYFRNNGATKIGYEDDLFSGISPDFGPYEVDDALIQAVAERRGGFEEFKLNDRQRKSLNVTEK